LLLLLLLGLVHGATTIFETPHEADNSTTPQGPLLRRMKGIALHIMVQRT
jgi:hypothetical protein